MSNSIQIGAPAPGASAPVTNPLEGQTILTAHGQTPTQKMRAIGAVEISEFTHAVRQHSASVEAAAEKIAAALEPKFEGVYDRLDAITRIMTEQMHRFEKRIEQVERESKERDERIINKMHSIDTRLVAVEGHVRDLQARRRTTPRRK